MGNFWMFWRNLIKFKIEIFAWYLLTAKVKCGSLFGGPMKIKI